MAPFLGIPYWASPLLQHTCDKGYISGPIGAVFLHDVNLLTVFLNYLDASCFKPRRSAPISLPEVGRSPYLKGSC